MRETGTRDQRTIESLSESGAAFTTMRLMLTLAKARHEPFGRAWDLAVVASFGPPDRLDERTRSVLSRTRWAWSNAYSDAPVTRTEHAVSMLASADLFADEDDDRREAGRPSSFVVA